MQQWWRCQVFSSSTEWLLFPKYDHCDDFCVKVQVDSLGDEIKFFVCLFAVTLVFILIIF